MRSGKELQDAVTWFQNNAIPLYGVNKNPTQESWTQSPKCYADLYIDDAALGTPLIYSGHSKDFPNVDWEKVRDLLVEMGLV